MRHLKVFLLLLCPLLSFTLYAQTPDEAPELLRVTEAITVFQQDPLTAQGVAAAGLILEFAEKSNLVEVKLYPPVFPWLGSDAYPPYSDLLAAGYAAGDIQAQLASGVRGEQTLPAVQMTLRIYEKIKNDDKDFKLPVMETLLDAQRKGELAKLLFPKSSE